ncbi:hypothetical protein TRVL_10368 [Trypanosoma vivax]|nr:hypothetical protein TRVL_10368 [Trypanosoma vivax]
MRWQAGGVVKLQKSPVVFLRAYGALPSERNSARAGRRSGASVLQSSWSFLRFGHATKRLLSPGSFSSTVAKATRRALRRLFATLRERHRPSPFLWRLPRQFSNSVRGLTDAVPATEAHCATPRRRALLLRRRRPHFSDSVPTPTYCSGNFRCSSAAAPVIRVRLKKLCPLKSSLGALSLTTTRAPSS